MDINQTGDDVCAIQVHGVLFFNQDVAEFPVLHGEAAGDEFEVFCINLSVFVVHWNLRTC